MIINQANLFLIFTLNGIVIGMLFDIFRILRKCFKTSDVITCIQDVLFWIITGFILLYSVFAFSGGEVRFYMFLGVFIGCLLYMVIFSKYFVNINVKIIKVLKTIIYKLISIVMFPIKIIIKILKKIFYKPTTFIIINIRKINLNCRKRLKNLLKNTKKKIHT